MKTKSARPSPVGWALILIGLIVGAAGVVLRTRTQGAAPPLDAVTAAAHGRIEQALRAQARALEPAVSEASRIPELMASLKMGADRVTTQDLLENEDWWSRFRSHYAFTAIVADTTLAILGPGVGNVGDSAIVQEARARGAASGVLPGDGRAFVAAAASASQTGRPGKPPVIVLGEVIDGAKLAAVAGLTGDAVGVADETKLLEAGGQGVPLRDLAPLVGHGGAPAVLLGDGRVGAAWPLGGELFLLAAFPPPPAAPTAVVPALLLVGTGALLVLFGVIVALLRRGGQEAAAQAGGRDDLGATTSERVRLPAGGAKDRTPFPGAGSPPAALRPRDGGSDRHTEPGPGMGGPQVGSAAASAAVSYAPTGQSRMGRYELIERIGEGGMAEIFFAAARGEKNFVRYFVVKRMHPHVARHREAVDQFTDEARLQAALVHSNIVPVFDFGVEQGEYFLALEYIHGRDVGQVLERHVEHFGRPMDVATTFYVLHEALEALEFAHSQADKDGSPLEIVHRDVSPGNVLVSYRGEVKLTDFGIAKSDRRLSRTEVGTVKGNAAFMSPEQARGEPADQRSDLFSAGMVMYYCLSGQLLYRGETTVNRLLRAAVGPATAQFGQIDQLPAPAAKVLNRALAVDREKRYQSAAEFAHDLIPHMATRQDVTVLMDELFPAELRRDLR